MLASASPVRSWTARVRIEQVSPSSQSVPAVKVVGATSAAGTLCAQLERCAACVRLSCIASSPNRPWFLPQAVPRTRESDGPIQLQVVPGLGGATKQAVGLLLLVFVFDLGEVQAEL